MEIKFLKSICYKTIISFQYLLKKENIHETKISIWKSITHK